MATNRDLLKEAIEDAKTVKETAIANAKMALEEAFTPFLKEKLSAKLAEMEQEDELRESENEEVSLDELLAELEGEELEEAKKDDEKDSKKDDKEDKGEKGEESKDEEELNIEDMTDDDLKSFVEDVIKDMIEAGELEAGHEGMEDEPGAGGEEMLDLDAENPEGEEVELGAEEIAEEEFDLDELLAELEEGSLVKGKKASDKTNHSWPEKGKSQKEKGREPIAEDQLLADPNALVAIATVLGISVAALKQALSDASKAKNIKNKKEGDMGDLMKELNEIKVLNAKLLYTNKIFREKSLTESQKIKVLSSFDKATSKKEAELIYATLSESLKISNKNSIKESLGSASKPMGGAASKPIIENDAFARMRELAGLKK